MANHIVGKSPRIHLALAAFALFLFENFALSPYARAQTSRQTYKPTAANTKHMCNASQQKQHGSTY
jgi:hypothetical protein